MGYYKKNCLTDGKNQKNSRILFYLIFLIEDSVICHIKQFTYMVSIITPLIGELLRRTKIFSILLCNQGQP